MMAAVKWLMLVMIWFAFPGLQASEPGTVALEFLEKVREGEVNLEPGGDTALSPHTANTKRRQIARSLASLAADLKNGTLEIGEVREDQDFAAVMVRKVSGFDASGIQVFPVALVKKGANWIPAPVLASFENSVMGYTVPLKQRLLNLEHWMSRERVLSLERLMTQSSEKMRNEIRKDLNLDLLIGDDVGAVVDGFLKACAEGRHAAMLGFLGGLSDPLPENWASRLRATNDALAKTAARNRPWRLMISQDVIRMIVNQETGTTDGLVSVAFLDPDRVRGRGSLGMLDIIHFAMRRDGGGRWRIDLPDSLVFNDRRELEIDEGFDVDLMDEFPRRLREEDGLINANTAEEAKNLVVNSLRTEGLRNLLRLVDFGSGGKEARVACLWAAEVWWTMNQPNSFRIPFELAFREDGEAAVAVFQWFTPQDPDRFEMRTMYFSKYPGGWKWASGLVTPTERDSYAKLAEWVNRQEKFWRIDWRASILAGSERLKKLDFSKVASEQQARELGEKWLDAINQTDLTAATALTAWLDDGEPPFKALRNLSYHLADPLNREGKAAIHAIHRSDLWTAVEIQYPGGISAFALVVLTPSGPRFLPEIDLLNGDNRTRRFLNRTSFDRLAAFTEKETLRELETLFADFEESAVGWE